MLFFQNRWWSDESPLITKLRKHGGKEQESEGKVEEDRGIVNDTEIEFVIEVFLCIHVE